MTRSLRAIGLLGPLFLLSAPAAAALPPVQPPPAIAAKAHVLIDFTTGKVLAAQNEHARLEPASLTKVMTAYAIFKALQQNQVKLTDNVFVSERAWREGGASGVILAAERLIESLRVVTLLTGARRASELRRAERVIGGELRLWIGERDA